MGFNLVPSLLMSFWKIQDVQDNGNNHIYYDKMEVDNIDFVKAFPISQRLKKSKKKYGQLPPKKVIMTLWGTASIYLIDPYPVTDR